MELTPALRCERVSFAYGTRPVLRGVTCQVDAGESVALLGRNGAGKTTLARLIAGLERPDAGVVWVGDWDAGQRRPEELARRIASVFQRADQQVFGRTVQADVEFGPRNLGVPPEAAAARASSALAELGLLGVAAEHPYDLSLSRRKLVALAGALALDPALLVLDEPTAGLDRSERAAVGRTVRARAQAGCAVLCITHDLDFAVDTLERAITLRDGAVCYDGKPNPG